MSGRAGASELPWRVRSFEALASTSDTLAALAAAGEPERLAVLAARQTAGRGSRGRSWTSSPGGLAVSVLLRPGGSASAAGQWALLAAVVLLDTLSRYLPRVPSLDRDIPRARLTLKWPNDLLLSGRKVGGILIDSASGPQGELLWLVIGFGANLAAPPELDDRSAAGLGTSTSPGEVAAALLARVDHWRHAAELDRFATVRRTWLLHAHPVGAPLRVRAGSVDVSGRFAGLAEDGALLLQIGDKVRAFPTGEILQAGEA